MIAVYVQQAQLLAQLAKQISKLIINISDRFVFHIRNLKRIYTSVQYTHAYVYNYYQCSDYEDDDDDSGSKTNSYVKKDMCAYQLETIYIQYDYKNREVGVFF